MELFKVIKRPSTRQHFVSNNIASQKERNQDLGTTLVHRHRGVIEQKNDQIQEQIVRVRLRQYGTARKD
jgi:hypothetical protein